MARAIAGRITGAVFTADFNVLARDADADFRALTGRRVLRRAVRDAAIAMLTFLTATAKNVCYFLRRSTIKRSARRLCRVFAPNVGKPHGVCGWLPFTRPSPPPCG
jgi:hypothetical protein